MVQYAPIWSCFISDNLALEHLRHIRAATDRIQEDLRDVKFRVGQMEGTVLQLVHRMDRFDEGLNRVETRLGLLDTKH